MRLFQLLLLASMVFSCQSGNTDSTVSAEYALRTRDQITDYNPGNDERPLNELIQIDGIYPGSIIGSPYRVTGKAKQSWYFEGDFPVLLQDENGTLLSSAPATALDSRKGSGWIPFKADIIFIAAPNTEARLIFKLDNPSETEGFQRAIEVPIILQ
ncbi:Gmad2 immunoglobulin-like domain-containing protein [Neolewinella persica]|uniref:Gmad2 immunoglobulin-like domain-containing protein n=1 Tax=Neolewinella persica TaxID=70998 RepID=UPI0005C59365|nr:Gmad2 immunoglobulin-like domain-containing protein [Neolewinella persica]